MATVLKKFGAQWMRNEEHFGFMTFVAGRLELLTAEGTEKAVAAFRDALKAEDEALEQQRRSVQTAAVVQLDVERDRAWRSLQLLAMSGSLNPSEVIAAAAERVLGLIDRYGDPRDLPYTQANGVYLNLGQDLTAEPFAADIKTLSAEGQVQTLLDKNKAFMAAFTERNAERAAIEAGRVKAARRALDVAWRNLTQLVNVLVSLNGEEGAAGFITEVNRQIDYQRTVQLNRAALNEKKRAEKEAGTKEENS